MSFDGLGKKVHPAWDLLELTMSVFASCSYLSSFHGRLACVRTSTMFAHIKLAAKAKGVLVRRLPLAAWALCPAWSNKETIPPAMFAGWLHRVMVCRSSNYGR